jgi:EAL domain-containing protein (putative c-di-GMP-specific phosphodiesterase class I)/signal transduction histidine kinase
LEWQPAVRRREREGGEMIQHLRSIGPYLQTGGLIVLLLAAAILLAASYGGDQITADATISRQAEAVLGATAQVQSTARESMVIGRSWVHGVTSSDELDEASAANSEMVAQLQVRVTRLVEAIDPTPDLARSSISHSMADLDLALFEMTRRIDERQIDEAAWVVESRLSPAVAALSTEVTTLRDEREARIVSVNQDLGLVVTAAQFLIALVGPALVVFLIFRAKRLGRLRTHLSPQLERERELLRNKAAFLAAVSHHINTPLTGVVGLTQLLQDRTNDFNAGVRNEIIDLLAIQAQETAHVVDDILVAGRADFGEMIVIEDKVDLRRIVEEAITGLGSTVRSRITIRGSAMAHADHKWVEHIIRNLVRNAGSYGGENILVRMSTAYRKVVVEVVDDGVGLPTESEDVVFQAYHTYRQLDGMAPSLGLGLSVARTLARAMGGDLAYKRDAEQSVFELSLPVGIEQDQDASPSPDLTIHPLAGHPTRPVVEQVLAAGGPNILFQPIVDLQARHRGEERVFGYEALSRFEFASPPEWFEAAQAAGLQLELDLVCAHAALEVFPSDDLEGCLAINVHDSTLMSSRLMEALEGLDPSRIVIELSETASIRSYERTKEVVDTLRERGIRLAIDDVGSGEIDMWHILRLQPAMIKMDISLVRDVDSTPRNRALIRGLTTMANDLGILVVGEGVQRREEEELLLELGVQFGQGYLFGRPRTARWTPKVLPGGSLELADHKILRSQIVLRRQRSAM